MSLSPDKFRVSQRLFGAHLGAAAVKQPWCLSMQELGDSCVLADKSGCGPADHWVGFDIWTGDLDPPVINLKTEAGPCH